MIDRRGFLLGLGGVIAAPAIVSLANIMPVRNRLIVPDWSPLYFPAEWEENKLIQFTKEINREWVLENLFAPYMDTWRA